MADDLTIRVRRADPEREAAPFWQTYSVPAQVGATVLAALNHIKNHLDPSLVFRRSCEQGVCGSDAMVINGRNRLACRTLLADVGSEITIVPLPGLPIIRDLVVDMTPFFANYRAVSPYLISDRPAPQGAERLQSPEAKARYENSTSCILCGACSSSCPVFQRGGDYIGPAALVAAHRFLFDDRDDGGPLRKPVVADLDGALGCRTAFSCTEVCPRGVHVTRAVAEVKEWIRRGREV
jgi:succinate dehydrogenase / fumarate reductase iron-sulfur subunit